ncbi:hypothetical protein JCM24511_03016 [Saitozyma sp. JCM 24511]|nr:hypothetical protein JCM24511_03016 [Saitozyma sp. JCM 24511]
MKSTLVLGVALGALGAAATITGQQYCNDYVCVTGLHDNAMKTDTSTASMVAPSDFGWIAMGFGSQMVGSPMIIAWPNADGSFTISQRQATQQAMPMVVPNPARKATLVTSTSFKDSSGVGITFTLPSNSSVTNSTSLIWAYGATNPKSSSANATLLQHLASGNAQLALLAPITNTSISGIADSAATGSAGSGSVVSSSGTSRSILIAHIVCGALATMFFLPVGILVPRIARGLSSRRWWFPIHSTGMGIFAFGFVVAAFSIARTYFPGRFNSKHRKLGLSLFILVIFQVLLGIFVHWGRGRIPKTGTSPGRGPTNFIHMAFGLVIVATGFATAWEGLNSEWPLWSGTGAANVGWKVGWGLIVGITTLAYLASLIFLLPRQLKMESAKRGGNTSSASSPSRPIPHSGHTEMRYPHLYGRGSEPPPLPPNKPASA